MTSVAVSDVADLLDKTASDPQLDPASRISALRDLRADLSHLTGLADRYMSDQELQREGDAITRVSAHVGAGEDANVRGDLLDRGIATPEQADAAGLLSHDQLQRRAADGSLEEAIIPFAPIERSEYVVPTLGDREVAGNEHNDEEDEDA